MLKLPQMLLIAAMGVAGLSMQAQDLQAPKLLITGANGDVRELPLEEISKITFSESGFEVAMPNVNSIPEKFEFADVAKISFWKDLLGIDGIAADGTALRLLENPVGDMLRLSGADASTPVEAVVTDLSGGRRVAVAEWTGADIDVSALNPGIYILTAGKETIKFIKR